MYVCITGLLCEGDSVFFSEEVTGALGGQVACTRSYCESGIPCRPCPAEERSRSVAWCPSPRLVPAAPIRTRDSESGARGGSEVERGPLPTCKLCPSVSQVGAHHPKSDCQGGAGQGLLSVKQEWAGSPRPLIPGAAQQRGPSSGL